MEQRSGLAQKIFDKIKGAAEKTFWPNFGKRGIPELVKIRLETLPEPIQLEYLEEYESEVTRFRNTRNFSLVAFAILVVSTGSFWGPLGIFLYWLHLKYKKIPDVAGKIMQSLQIRYNLKPNRARTNVGGRTFQSVEEPHRHRPRKIVEDYDPSSLSVDNLKEGYMVDYDLKTWLVTTTKQFDWDTGISAREFKLVSDIESIWVYLFKEGNHLTVTVNKPINIYAIDSNLETEIYHNRRPFNIITYQGIQYFRENALDGYLFNITSNSTGVKTNTWEYYDQERKHYMRIEQQEQKNFRAVVGKIVSEFEFSEILPQRKQ